MARCSTRYITRGEGLRILAESMHELKFCMTQEEAEYARNRACKYKSRTDIKYCMEHHNCRGCSVDRAYNDQLRTIANLNVLLKEVSSL